VDDTVTLLVDAWSRHRPAEHVEKRVAEDEEHGPEHLVRILHALELSARQTGGTLSRATEQLTADDGGGELHHMVELIHDAGALAAVSMARELDQHTRRRMLELLRFYWQSPTRNLTRPLKETEPRRRNLWRS